MSKPKPYTMQVIDAVGASGLPQDIRHLLVTMAYLANSKTGQGFSGQDTIGRFMGCSEREVRRKLDRLEQIESPVQVVRRARFRKDGARTSDEYFLRLDHRTPTSAGTTGRPRPQVEAEPAESPPDVKRTTTGRETSAPPDAHVRGSSQMILGVDPRSLFVAPESATVAVPKRSKARGSSSTSRSAKPKPTRKAGVSTRTPPERTPEQKAAFTRIRDFYFEQFEVYRGKKPIFGGAEGSSIYTLLEKFQWDEAEATVAIATAFQSFRGKSVTILNIAANPQGFEAQPAKAGTTRVPGAQPGDDYDFDRYEARNA